MAHPQSTPSTFTCPPFGQTRPMPPSQIKKLRYCSLECRRAAMTYGVCPQCGKDFVFPRGRKARYCSRACYTSARQLTDAQFVARFWSLVEKNGPVLQADLGPCWLFTGHLDKDGYGILQRGRRGSTNSVTKRANRFSYELAKGRLRPGQGGRFVVH